MKTNTLKTAIKVASVIVCLFIINEANAQRQAQRHARRLPDKALKLEAIEEETNQLPYEGSSSLKGHGPFCSTTIDSKEKPLVSTGPRLKNGITLTNSFTLKGNYTGASVINNSSPIEGNLKRKLIK